MLHMTVIAVCRLLITVSSFGSHPAISSYLPLRIDESLWFLSTQILSKKVWAYPQRRAGLDEWQVTNKVKWPWGGFLDRREIVIDISIDNLNLWNFTRSSSIRIILFPSEQKSNYHIIFIIVARLKVDFHLSLHCLIRAQLYSLPVWVQVIG